MGDKWRAAVIACGRMSYAHGRAYAALPDVDLVACADISPEALVRFGEEFGIPEERRFDVASARWREALEPYAGAGVPDVEGLVCGEDEGRSFVDSPLGDLLIVDEARSRAP